MTQQNQVRFRSPFAWRSCRALAVITALFLSGVALAEPRIVATTTSMGVLARVVGGAEATVTTLVPPDRDAHDLTARPSMIAALRRADVLVAVGAQLEEGWLPAALDGAANPRLRAGQPGHFSAADALHLRDTHFDPSFGAHVHEDGNPHFNLSPAHMAEAAMALALRMGGLYPDKAGIYRARAVLFRMQVRARLPHWRDQLATPLRAIAYHEEFDYFAEWLPLQLVGFIEPVPGVPPTSRHLSGLIERQRGSDGVVLHADYQPGRAPSVLGETLGWPVLSLPMEPARADPASWFELVEHWATALATAGSRALPPELPTTAAPSRGGA